MKRSFLSPAAHDAYVRPAVARIARLAEEFVAEIVEIARDACHDAVLSELATNRHLAPEQAPPQERRPVKKAREQSPLAEAASAAAPTADLAQEGLQRLVLRYIDEHPECRIADLKQHLGLAQRHVLAPIRELLSSELVLSRGTGANTRYFVNKASLELVVPVDSGEQPADAC